MDVVTDTKSVNYLLRCVSPRDSIEELLGPHHLSYLPLVATEVHQNIYLGPNIICCFDFRHCQCEGGEQSPVAALEAGSETSLNRQTHFGICSLKPYCYYKHMEHCAMKHLRSLIACMYIQHAWSLTQTTALTKTTIENQT